MTGLRRSAAPLLFLLVSPLLARAGELRGTVRYHGPISVPAPLAVTKDRETCGLAQRDESLWGEGGGLAGVVLTIPPVVGVTIAPAKLRLVQERCRFAPRVQVAPVGSTVEVVNADPILHSAHGFIGKATAFDVQTPGRDDRVTKTLARAGLVKIGCDVHSWMAAFIQVSAGPAAVSDASGGFRLSGLPAGRYTLTAWHERLGTRTVEVAVPTAGEAMVEIRYGE